MYKDLVSYVLLKCWQLDLGAWMPSFDLADLCFLCTVYIKPKLFFATVMCNTVVNLYIKSNFLKNTGI